METVELHIHKVLTSTPDTVERSTATRIQAVKVQFHTFLTSAPETVER